MRPILLLLSAALLGSSAVADTLVTNINGIQAGDHGDLQHFSDLIVGDDGKVRTVLTGALPLIALARTIDGQGRTMRPGLIDAHGHASGLRVEAVRALAHAAGSGTHRR